MKKKNPVLLIAGVLLLAFGIFFCYKTYHGSYAESKSPERAAALSAVKSEIADTKEALAALSAADETDSAEAEVLNTSLKALETKQEALNAEKLALEKPYSYSLTLLFIGLIVTIAGIIRFFTVKEASAKADLTKLAQAGLLAALCYIGFAFFKIDIPVGTEKTAFHLGNVFCVLAALLLGGFWGGLSGAVGMTIADLTTAYVTSAPKTFVLKFCIGLLVGLVAHGIFKLNKLTDKKTIVGVTVLASVCGMAFNVVADPLVGYFYKTYLLGLPQDLTKALLKVAQLTTTVNALLAVVFASIFYLALRPALKKAGLMTDVK